ncbi:hypothetical protein L6164_037695 [Bauhinia variegata]|uniref:Uncharacterized protein n=1 Tax=Bauhinia variegata TaxID=167791 RepID=A0ACB9KL10_BAUVA|nr:hypothetical protein L6164_037695 [Bauhinia variegata]
MKRNLENGVAMLNDSYNYLGQEVQKLRHEAMEIEKEVSKVAEAMSLKMQSLESKAEDIGNMAGISLDKQQKLLDGQSTALEGLSSLFEFQSKALEESRKTLQHFAEYGHKQQEELIQRQNQLQQLHDRLMANSKSIVPWLYLGLCATLVMEISLLYFSNDHIEEQTWIISMIRSAFMLVASAWLLYAIFTYRDHEMLNHKMLVNLVDKVNKMEKQKELSWEMDSDVDCSEWIDEDLPDDVNCVEDPDYMLPEVIRKNSITASTTLRKYNLSCRNYKN